MRQLVPILLLIALIVSDSCQNSKKPPKEYFLEKDVLVSVLVDIHILHSLQSTVKFKEITTQYDSIDPFSPVFARYGITKAAFDSTIAYYSDNPAKMVFIYDEVLMSYELNK